MDQKNNNSDFDISPHSPPAYDILKKHGSLNIRKMLDKIIQDAGYGNLSNINYLASRGFNILRHGQQQMLGNRDNMGYTFFTRPILNLTYDNLAVSDRMTLLQKAESMSWRAWVRTTLDPWGQMKLTQAGDHSKDGDARTSGLVNVRNPFIPLLSNTLTSLSGWKDVTLNDYESSPGINNERWSMMNGFFDVVDTFELSSDFKNIEGDPISLLFQTWEEYMVQCLEGEMNPYPDFVQCREFDYNSRIYRFVMDHTRTYIQKWTATIAWPSSTPHGSQFNFSVDKNYTDSISSIPITWKCVGADYNNPRLFHEFNTLVEIYNPGLRIIHGKLLPDGSLQIADPDGWVKLGPDEKNRGNFHAIPLINYVNQELCWYVDKDTYIRHIRITPEERAEDEKIMYKNPIPGEAVEKPFEGIDPHPESQRPRLGTGGWI